MSIYRQDFSPPAIIETKNRTINIINTIFAIAAAPAAIPVKPNTAAINATIKKINANRNMAI